MSSLHDWQVSLLKKKLGAKIGSRIIAAVVVVASKRKTTHQIWRQYLWIFLRIHKNEFCISKMCILCLGLLILPIGMEAERFVVLICYGVLQVPLVIGITAKLDVNIVHVERRKH